MTDKELGTAAGEIFAKAFTLGYETGREYVPVGGRVLTAELVEDVRALVWLDGRRNFDAFHRLRALFPATEPAKEADEEAVGDPLQAWKEFLKPKPIGWYRTMELDFAAKHFGFPSNPVFEDRYTAPDGGKWQWTDELQWELRCYPPAPAEPAEEHCTVPPEGWWCSRAANHDGPCAASEGVAPWVPQPLEADWLDQVDPRDPQSRTHRETAAAKFAEPAEEETKAEEETALLCSHPMCRHTNWGGRNRKHLRFSDCPIVPVPASSPVVPAPTETGPWQTWQEVPDGIPYRAKRYPSGLHYVNRNGVRFLADGSKSISRTMQSHAPFVAAKEGRA